MIDRVVSSESVTMGHPDKICDGIADSVLDEILKKDENARVACEVICKTGMVMVFGEVSTNCYVDIAKIVRNRLKFIGYSGAGCGFDADSCSVICSIDEQSRDIYKGVFKKNCSSFDSVKAGDQGIVFGYACDETKEYMPFSIVLAHKLAKNLDIARKTNLIPYLKPDGKTQVSVAYEDYIPKYVEAVVVSCQHDKDIPQDKIEKDIINFVVSPSIESRFLSEKTKFYVNPAGRFVIGGPVGDAGLTGRKLIVDSYGGASKHGGGAFSGKDPTKIDRSGAYYARYIAKNIVAAELAKRCEVEICYVIGVLKPISININSFGTGKISDLALKNLVMKVFDFRPAAIIEKLNLKKPIYSELSVYGHFGREDVFCSWEQLDMVESLKNFASSLIIN